MSNPFEMIDVRLSTIESLLISLKHGLPIPPHVDNEQPVTVKEICSFLGVTEPTVIRWRKKGKIPFMQVGSRVLFQKSAVLEALQNKNGAANK